MSNYNSSFGSNREHIPYGENSQRDKKPNKGGLLKAVWIATASSVAIFIVVSLIVFGWYQIDETEYAVVRTFGQVEIVEEPGFKIKIPYIQHVKKIDKSSKQFAIGYSLETGESIDKESFMITSDYNFINVDFYFEYYINDPIAYLYNSEKPELIVKNLAQSYIRDTVGTHKVDEVLTTGKTEIQTQIKDLLSARLEEENIGIMITNAVIQDSEVPTAEVAQAFKNVEDAKQGMETAINNAKKDQNTRIPEAEANADKIIKNANAEKAALIAEAEGQTARFNSLYDEYIKFPLVTKERMMYETLEKVLPNMDIYITDGNNANVLLPLDQFNK